MSAQQKSIKEALETASTALTPVAGEEARLESELLLSEALEKTRSHLFAWPEQALPPDQLDQFDALIEQRLSGRPIAYILGKREFWSLELRVTQDTLIPRPETETLVERALELIPVGTVLHLADLGTGSGAIAAAIASERPLSRITACDRSVTALAVAEGNFRQLKLPNIITAAGSWCRALPPGERFDLIVSNPPYVAEGDPHLTRNGLPWEPREALTAGADGLDDIRRIISQSPTHLKAGGRLLLEHGPEQGAAVRQLMMEGGFLDTVTHRDLAHRERITEGVNLLNSTDPK